jgi:hypothetical protein
MYLLGDGDQWWKIQDHIATPVCLLSFTVTKLINSGRLVSRSKRFYGLVHGWWSIYGKCFPSCVDTYPDKQLVYDRESPRLEPYGSESERQHLAAGTQVEQDTPRAPARTHGIALHASEGQAQHIEHLPSPPQHMIHLPSPPQHMLHPPSPPRYNAPMEDLLGDELPPFPTQAVPPPVSRPLPPVPTHPPAAPDAKVEHKTGEDEDVSMS